MKYGFDNEKYLRIQSERIKERISQFEGKLYMELGGKLFDDYHACRVLPGFEPDSKLRMLEQMKDSLEIIIVISALDIEKNKLRGDLGIPYDMDVLRLKEEFEKRGLLVSSVAISHYMHQPSADAYRKKLSRLGIKTYRQRTIEGYPKNVALIDSDEGFGRNDYIETTRPLVIVTAPGPGSGKMACCLSQLYLEHKRGVKAGYAKFETFPIWNLSLKHPLNLAYEAATADLDDVNMVDPFHLEAYGQMAVNYNRDVEIYPVLSALFDGIYGTSPYKSPTDMGVNMIGFCMSDEQVCCDAARHEIIRRYFTSLGRLAQGDCDAEEVNKLKLLMSRAGVNEEFRRAVAVARERKDATGVASEAIELPDGTILAANTSPFLGPSAALLLNATKHLAGIDHSIKLIPQHMIEPIQKMKVHYLGGHNPRLHTDEVLVALAMLSESDPYCAAATDALPKLRGCQVHSTVLLPEVDRKVFTKLGIGLTCDPIRK